MKTEKEHRVAGTCDVRKSGGFGSNTQERRSVAHLPQMLPRHQWCEQQQQTHPWDFTTKRLTKTTRCSPSPATLD